jgi:hypothetical protein
LAHLLVDRRTSAPNLAIEPRRGTGGKGQMKQVPEEDPQFAVRHLHLKAQETGQALGHRADVTAGQFAIAHLVDDFITVRAIVEISALLIIAYTMLKTGKGYHELGGNYLEQINKVQLQRYFVKRLQRLGFKVTIEPDTAAA